MAQHPTAGMEEEEGAQGGADKSNCPRGNKRVNRHLPEGTVSDLCQWRSGCQAESRMKPVFQSGHERGCQRPEELSWTKRQDAQETAV